MAIKRLGCLSIFILLLSSTGKTADTGKTFPTLTIGPTTYTNASITDVSGGTIFLRHSRGFETLRIESLSPEVQQQLGVQPSVPDRSRRKNTEPAAATTATATTPKPNRASNPESASAQQLWRQRLEGIFSQNLGAGKTAMAVGLPLVSMVMMLVGAIWLIVAGFRVSAGWGICCLLGSFLCGLLNLIFVCCNWHEAKKPFLCYLAGLVLFVASIMAMPNLLKQSQSSDSPPAAVRARGQ